MDEAAAIKADSKDSLQQMSEDMKLQIAQLKAELGNSDNPSTSVTSPLQIVKHSDKSICGILLKAENVSSPRKPSAEVPLSDMTEQPTGSLSSDVHEIEMKDSQSVVNLKGVSEGEIIMQNSVGEIGVQQPEAISSNIFEEVKDDGKVRNSLKNSSSSINSNSTPCSASEPIDVKYLQMSTASPKLVRKRRVVGKSSSTPNSARGCRSGTRDELYKLNYEKLEEKLLKLQMQCEVLAEENIKLKREERAKAMDKIATLKRSNGELANIAKRLEEKARALQEQNVKKSEELSNITRELQQQKRHYQRHKGRWEAEIARVTSQSNEQLSIAKKQLEDLKRALGQLRRSKYLKETDDDSEAIKQKEMLRLQKLASAASTKVVVRSLSTPTTARQKILEESNRGLRKQLSTLENQLEESEKKLTSLDEAEGRLREAGDEVGALKSSVALLETELQRAKVEASDASVQLSELRHVHKQVEDEYAAVHEQLAVAIKERDQAVRRCLDEGSKLTRMQDAYTDLENEKRSLREEVECEKRKYGEEVVRLERRHEEEIAGCQRDMNDMQKKMDQVEFERAEIKKKMDEYESEGRSNLSIIGSKKVLQTVVNSAVSLDQLPTNNSSLNIEQVEKHSPASSSDDPESDSFASHSEGECEVERKSLDARLFVAKYSYDPFQGPNENPECELPLATGDFLYIHGQPDEDGFYKGEKLDGRRGLVPSNFVEPLHGGDKPTRSTESLGVSPAPSSTMKTKHIGDELLPHPTDLVVSVHEHRDIIIEWNAPLLDCDDVVSRYDVIVDGRVAKASLNERVELEGSFDASRESHVISVCCVTKRGRSDPGHCVTTISGGTPKIEGFTCDYVDCNSARVSWCPVDSALACKISVREVQSGGASRSSGLQRIILVPRPMYKHKVEGLKPDVEYDVCVEAKGVHGSDTCSFCTPSTNPPAPPLNVDVVQTLSIVLVSWNPQTRDNVVGYQVYMSGNLIATSSGSRCQVEEFASILVALLKQNLTFQLPDLSFVEIPPVWVAVRAVGSGGQLSDFSSPFYLPASFVQSLCQEANYDVTIGSWLQDDDVGTKSTSIHLDTSSSSSTDTSNKRSFCRKAARSPTAKPSSRPTGSPGKLSPTKSLRSLNASSTSLDEAFGLDGRGIRKSSLPDAQKDLSGSSASDKVTNDSPLSLYVALFDYKPSIMSPNSDCYEEELEFNEGQLIKVYGGPDDDGFLSGQDRQGRRGFVPSNMVANVEVEDYTMLEVLFDRGALSTASLRSTSPPHEAKHLDSSFPTDGPASGGALYRALYDYDPREASPNIDSEIELSFARGDLINIVTSVDEDGFFRGEINGQYGLVPSNFVEKVDVGRPRVVSSSASNASSSKVKKKGMLSKGRRLLRKLGSEKSKR